MSTPPRILPGCDHCEEGHDPAIECRFKPAGPRMMLPCVTDVTLLYDATGKLVGVKHRPAEVGEV